MLTNDIPIPDPDRILTFKGRKLGISESDIYLFDDASQRWYRHGEAPFYAANATIKGNKLLLFNSRVMSYYSYDLDANTFTDEKIKPHFDLTANSVRSVIFETGSRGCFHSSKDSLVYIGKGEKFIAQFRDSTSKHLNTLPKSLRKNDIDQLINLVNEAQESSPSVADYNFTKADIEDFISFIIKKKKEKLRDHLPFNDPYQLSAGADVAFYTNTAKNIYNIPNETIGMVLTEFPRNFSTTTNWVKATFVFQDGTMVSLYDDTINPNYMRAAYTIMCDGLIVKCMSVKVAEKLNQLTNGLFCEAPYNSKRYALFNIVDFMFRNAAENDD